MSGKSCARYAIGSAAPRQVLGRNTARQGAMTRLWLSNASNNRQREAVASLYGWLLAREKTANYCILIVAALRSRSIAPAMFSSYDIPTVHRSLSCELRHGMPEA